MYVYKVFCLQKIQVVCESSSRLICQVASHCENSCTGPVQGFFSCSVRASAVGVRMCFGKSKVRRWAVFSVIINPASIF